MTRNTATDTSSSTTNTTPLGLAEARPLIGWRHSATWTYHHADCLGSGVGASLILSAETLQLARHPESALGCVSNSVVSCSAVAQSWQAEIAKFGGLSYPNAFFGIAAESVFITIAVIGLARVKVPRWFADLHVAGADWPLWLTRTG